MKKTRLLFARYLTLLVLALLSTNLAWGETYSMTIDSSDNGNNNVHWTNSNQSTLSHNNITWNTAITGTSSITTSKTYCQIGSKSNPATKISISTDGFAGKKITKVAVTCYCMSNEGPTLTVTAGSTTMINKDALTKTTSTEMKSADGTSATLGASDNLTIEFNSSAKAAICISKIEVTYESTPVAVEAPTFSVAAGNYTEAQTVELSCATEGASIYYTTDGTEPSAESTPYESAITVDHSMTIKAIAIKEAEKSTVATAAYKINVFTSLEDLVAAEIADGTTVKVSFENVMITDIFTNFSDKRVGIFLNVKAKNDKDIEIYFNNTAEGKTVPDGWIVGGKVSGTLTCPWTYYKNGDVWELCPDKDSEWTWGELTYTAPTTYNIIIADDIQNGTVEADMETAAEGVEVTLTINPEEGYKLGTLTVKDAAEGDVTVTDDYKFTMPASDVTVSATFEAIPTHEAKFFVNGVQYGETQNVLEGDEVVFPEEDPAAIGTRTFVGWTASQMPSASDEAPEFVESATMGTEDLNFYAVYAKKTEGGGNYEKVTTAPADWCGKYLIVYETETDKLAFDGSLTTLDAVGNTKEVEITDNIIASSEAMDAIAFTVAYKTGSNTVYSLKSASGKYISGTKATNKAGNGLVQADTDADFEISFDGTTIESKSSDQQMVLKYNKATDQRRFRFYKSGQQDIALYKKQEASYSGYCTDVPVTATITKTGYATFSCDYALDLDKLPAGLTAYFATYNEKTNAIHMEKATGKVPAKTGLFLGGNKSTQYDIPVTADDAVIPANNILKPTGEEDLVAGDFVYYISSEKFCPITNTTLSLSAGKAYIPKEEIPAEGPMTIDFGGEITGIEDVKIQSTVNGQQSTAVFNLQGIRVTTPKKGEVYIMNGKKYIMK